MATYYNYQLILSLCVGVTFTAEPSDGEVTCGDAFFPCRYTGTLSQPHWIINSTPYNSINSNLPPDHSYGSQVLRVTNLSGKDGIMYRCYILSLQRGTTCAYRSAVGQLNLSSCKGE